MKKKMRMSLILVSSLVSHATYARWPEFEVLSPQQIVSFATTQGCPAGKIRIPEGTEVPIKVAGIPPTEHWSWNDENNPQCFAAEESLQYLKLDKVGSSYPGKITTIYGINNVPLIHFVFNMPKKPWECGVFSGPNPPKVIGCAQDQ